MAEISFKGSMTINTNGDLPKTGEKAPAFTLVNTDLSRVSLANFAGKNVILNIFPSVDTGTCATSVRKFNEKAANLDNTIVVCISKDLPFAFTRFCGAEGIENVKTLSDFDGGSFGKDYQVQLVDGPLKGLLARAIVVIDATGTVKHTELVAELGNEPNYDAALSAL